jgi:hypothetical protein
LEVHPSEPAVPFVKDLLWAAGGLGWPSLAGVINSDILVTEELFERLQEAVGRHDVVICHRTDIPTLDTPPELGAPAVVHRSADGFFFGNDALAELHRSFPDYLLAHPYWDTDLIWWSAAMGYDVRRLRNHEILHLEHPRYWRCWWWCSRSSN